MVSEDEIKKMIDKFSHTDPSIAYSAAEELKSFVLGTDHSEKIFRALLVALETGDQSTRAYATGVFSYAVNEGIDITVGVSALTKALTDRWNVRMNAFDALKAAAMNGVAVPFNEILRALFESIEMESWKGGATAKTAKRKGKRQYLEILTAMRKQKQALGKGVFSDGLPKPPLNSKRKIFRARRTIHVQ